MDIMTHAKFHFNRLMLTLISGVWASEPPPPPRAWRTTEKAGPDRVKEKSSDHFKGLPKLKLLTNILCQSDLILGVINFVLSV